MGFTYYFVKALKIALIIAGLSNMSAILFYSLMVGFLEERILGFQMSTPSAICLGGGLIVIFVWSLSLIYDEVVAMLKTKRDWDKFNNRITQEQWDKVDEIIKKYNK
tara:strand:- start:176 stop:496 length:321 start_codon:yes stop_codon:yes gene_type:complete